MCTRIWASSAWQMSALMAALTIAVASSSTSCGSKPAVGADVEHAAQVFLGHGRDQESPSPFSSRCWTRKSTITSSMFHCGSWLSISNLSTSSILASSVNGSLQGAERRQAGVDRDADVVERAR